jgi:hypothetical protein
MNKYRNISVWLFASLLVLLGCQSKPTVPALFEVVDQKITGLDFVNKLTPTKEFNIFKYLYYYNGAGIGAGDFNNDGKIDLFFAANQGQDRLYLNQGELNFKNVTTEAKIPADNSWSTGVSVIDINNDGLLDIYICRVGKYENLDSRNQLLICQGIDKNGVPFYKDMAKEYGLDFKGFCTQAVFFDYDMDGDLDMYLMNHSIHQNGTFGIREKLLATKSPISGDRLFRNNGDNTFTEVTDVSGIHSSVLGYGLGITVSDIDLDGYPDIYVGNDFHENDYLYINQRNGTFKDELTEKIMHTSQFSMGVDIADLNNDGFAEIISMDMLPSNREILKRSLGEDEYDLFYNKITYGYNFQYSRNNLQYNRRNGLFSEVGLYAGIEATDWSWAPLFMDFDNDGLKDLFISNGISKRLNDIDYINYVTDGALQKKMNTNQMNENDLDLINKFPQTKIPNRFFKNKGELSFEDVGNQVSGNSDSYSNGAVYADLDNDGDLDIVVNNVDAPATVYKNTTNDIKQRDFLSIQLHGPPTNINALGAKVIVFVDKQIRTYENYPVRGFMSSMQVPIHIGLHAATVDSILLIWPDNTFQHISYQKNESKITVNHKEGLPQFDYRIITEHSVSTLRKMKDITSQTGIIYVHEENAFQEFNRELLLPHMLSTEGPALVVADMNGDGLDDVFIGASKWKKPAVFLQQASGKFIKSTQPDLEKDSTYEDVGACIIDVNNDGFPDLIVASGGNEYYGKDVNLTPRIYFNDGKGNFLKNPQAFDSLFINASCVVPYDFNNDGFVDLFIGGRSVPWNYGEIPRSYLLQNDGKGNFKDVTNSRAKDLSNIGLVTSALWYDIDKDGDQDLIITMEWGGIISFMNTKGNFSKKMLTDKKGWWNFVLPVDVNNDGHIDFIAGNLGLNSRLKASEKEPVRLYFNDFDDNGKKEQLLTYYLDGKEIQFANKGELERQLPIIKKRFLYASDFAKATLEEIFTKEKLKSADTLTANYFPNALLLNDGKMNFSVQSLPWQAQLTSYKTAVLINANGDDLPDILLGGNYYDNNIQMGRYDADFGTILVNRGKSKFNAESINGLQIKGQVRHIQKIKIAGKEAFILAKNNDSLQVIQFR